jgi:hypothetical protein
MNLCRRNCISSFGARIGLLLLAVLLCIVMASAAPLVSGSVSYWGYLRDDSVDHVQAVPALTLNVADLGDPAVRFEMSLRGYYDAWRKTPHDEQLRVLRGVFIWEPEKSPWQLRLGQQWLYEGVGRGNVAGLWVKRKFGMKTAVTAYGGARLLDSYSLSDRNEDGGVTAGANVRTKVDRVNLGASYFYLGKNGKLRYHAAGLEANARIVSGLYARARLEMNLGQSAIERAQLLAEWTARKNLVITGEFRTQVPRVYDDSFFTIFLDDATTTFARAAAQWQFYRAIYLRAGGSTLFSEAPDPLYKVYAAVGLPNVEAGYTHWVSVSKSTQDGLYLAANYRYLNRWDVYAGYDFARGSNADTDLRGASESHTAYVGGSVTPCSKLTVLCRVEQIRDLWHTSDWRALAGLTLRFSNSCCGGSSGCSEGR